MPPAEAGKPYHHGTLREALVAAAERLTAERPDWTFTLREVARAAGVSHNAPYHHFADRRALLAAVAARGFSDLTAALERRLDRGAADAADAGLRATAQAYVAFAVSRPSQFRLMFSAELAGCEDVAFKAAGERAFGVLSGLVARGVAAGRLRPDPHGTHALAAWSLVHGLATLLLDGRLPAVADDEAVAALAENLAAALIGGLAAPSC